MKIHNFLVVVAAPFLLFAECDHEEPDPVFTSTATFQLNGVRFETDGAGVGCESVAVSWSDSTQTSRDKLRIEISNCPERKSFLCNFHPFYGQDFNVPTEGLESGDAGYFNFIDSIQDLQYYKAVEGNFTVEHFAKPVLTSSGYEDGKFRARFEATLYDTNRLDTIHITQGFINSRVVYR